MTKIIQPQTARLKLRQWCPGDRAPFAELNSHPEVMEFFPMPQSHSESDAMADKCESLIAGRGWGFWAVEIKGTGEFIGFVGLHIPSTILPFSPCVEIGWRLARSYWGKGYATEAARAALQVGFEHLTLQEIVSFTAVSNRRSRAVMERLHMVRDKETFDHPDVPEESGLREHCLYRISREKWKKYTA
jgi:RimJ/RimL family protein N-acetyltransferase